MSLEFIKLGNELQKFIDELPDDEEWFHSSSKEDFEISAKELISLGVHKYDIMTILERLYRATANEFGM